MTQEEPWHNLSQWSLEELQRAEGSYQAGHPLGEEMRAEIRRRQAALEKYQARAYLLYLPLGIIVGITVVAIAIYALIRLL